MRADDNTLTRHRPTIPCGVCSGDVDSGSAVIWSRSDRPARMHVELAATEQFRRPRKMIGPDVLEHRDFTGKILVNGLPSGETVFYRVSFESLDQPGLFSEPVVGRFKTAPDRKARIRFVWSGDTCGQGFGIDLSRGGLRTYETMRQLQPDFFIHSGDTIYADNPFPESITLPDGTQWQNVVTPETMKVAESLDEFRANFRYNLLDQHLRRFISEVPTFAQWDDHETLNNWYPGESLEADERYTIKSASLLAARAKTAFFEYLPIRENLAAPGRIYRRINYGPLLDIFFIDMRSHRDRNSPNEQTVPEGAALLGRAQVNWLKRSLTESKATWKVIASDMPIGLIVADGRDDFEAVANGNHGPPLGRELEIAELLSHLKRSSVNNVVWLTADVHYAASHYYDPGRAAFQDFDPFWEFVSGPIHAGTFGPNRLDNTFGPQVLYQSVPDDMAPNRPPTEGLQFFGVVDIDPDSRAMTVTHYNSAGQKLWERGLNASD